MALRSRLLLRQLSWQWQKEMDNNMINPPHITGDRKRRITFPDGSVKSVNTTSTYASLIHAIPPTPDIKPAPKNQNSTSRLLLFSRFSSDLIRNSSPCNLAPIGSGICAPCDGGVHHALLKTTSHELGPRPSEKTRAFFSNEYRQ